MSELRKWQLLAADHYPGESVQFPVDLYYLAASEGATVQAMNTLPQTDDPAVYDQEVGQKVTQMMTRAYYIDAINNNTIELEQLLRGEGKGSYGR